MALKRKVPKRLSALEAQREKIDALGKSEPAPVPSTGRPPVMDERVLDKLEIAFSYGCSDTEACVWAGINPSTLYNYQRDFPSFVERKELLKQMPLVSARQSVSASFPKRPDIAMRFLEAKLPNEFNVKVNHHHTGELTVNFSEELDKRSKPYEPEVQTSDVPAVEGGSESDPGERTDGVHQADIAA